MPQYILRDEQGLNFLSLLKQWVFFPSKMHNWFPLVSLGDQGTEAHCARQPIGAKYFSPAKVNGNFTSLAPFVALFYVWHFIIYLQMCVTKHVTRSHEFSD